jgi:hypothetical protein
MGEGHVKIMEFRFDANQEFQVKAIEAEIGRAHV